MSTKLRKAKHKLWNKLKKKEGVMGIGIDRANQSLIVFLDKISVRTQEMLPKSINGIPIKIRFTGMPENLKERGNPITPSHFKVRPLEGGISISNLRSSGGTLSFVKEINDVPYMISNSHVFASEPFKKSMKNKTIVQPASLDGGTEEDKVGELIGYSPIKLKKFFRNPINYVDIAVAKVDENIEYEPNRIKTIGKILCSKVPNEGEIVKKYGRTSGLTYGTVISTDSLIEVSYGKGKTAIFDHQIVVQSMNLKRPFSVSGDSGSAVLTHKNEIIGIVFAGSFMFTFINPINTVTEFVSEVVRYNNRFPTAFLWI